MKKKIVALLLSAVLLIAVSPLAVMAQYSDMPAESHWSYKALSTASELGLLQGSNGKIAPNDQLTRAQMATILVRAFSATEKAVSFNFSDVAPNAWFYDAMSIAVNKGWFKGSGDKLRPNDPISRQEVFVVLARAIGAAADPSFSLESKFTDAASIASWAKVEAGAMAAKGYVSGSNGKMNPLKSITRAEFAQLMYNLIQGGEITVNQAPIVVPPQQDQNGNDSGSGSSGGGGGSMSSGGSGITDNDNDLEDPWGEAGDKVETDPVIPDEKPDDQPSMEDLTTSDEGWTGIY